MNEIPLISQKPQIPDVPLRFIFFALRAYRWRLLLAVSLTLLAEIFSGASSYALRQIVDAASTGDVNGGTQLTMWALGYPVLLLLIAVTYRVASIVIHSFTVRARTGTVRILFEYLSFHSTKYFSDRFAGALSNRVTTIAGNISGLVHQFIWNILSLLFSIVVSAFLLFTAYMPLAFAFVGSIVLLIPLNVVLTRPQTKLSARLAETAARLRGQVVDVFTNIAAVQQFARRDHEIQRLDETIEEHRAADVRSDYYGEFVIIVNNVVVGIGLFAAVLWSFTVWQSGGMSAGAFVMILNVSGGLLWQLSRIGQNINDISEMYGEVQEGVSEIILPHGITDTPHARALRVSGGGIEWHDVSFKYGSIDVFDSFNLSIQPGQRIGLVGPSGAGKSTFVSLLLRQHDLATGTITIDGQNIAHVTQDSLRANIAVVPQEPLLFHRSIRENIAYGKPDATDAEIEAVARKAQVHEFVEVLPQGYDTLVGERGVKLSGGQRQRIAIARAMLKNAPILILDEATSALDSESEVAIQKALHELMEGKTVVAIAHRLSTLREMDRIIVLENGKIVEDGTHADLVKKAGVYARLWTHQAGGFLQE